jgi:initiation factor 1A
MKANNKMVKNMTGGNKHKQQSRKLVNASYQNSALRDAKEEGEIYAQVISLLGNRMCHVMTLEGHKLLCHIRGKFRGKMNNISVGSWILVGLREWEETKIDSKKMNNCDLLEVYTDQDKEKLKKNNSVDWNLFINNDCKKQNITVEDDNMVEFSNKEQDEYKHLIEYVSTQKIQTINEKEEEINIDDI